MNQDYRAGSLSAQHNLQSQIWTIVTTVTSKASVCLRIKVHASDCTSESSILAGFNPRSLCGFRDEWVLTLVYLLAYICWNLFTTAYSYSMSYSIVFALWIMHKANTVPKDSMHCTFSHNCKIFISHNSCESFHFKDIFQNPIIHHVIMTHPRPLSNPIHWGRPWDVETTRKLDLVLFLSSSSFPRSTMNLQP